MAELGDKQSQTQSQCAHPGYLVEGGELVCAECGEPSPSERWRGNVFGVEANKAARKAREAQEG